MLYILLNQEEFDKYPDFWENNSFVESQRESSWVV